MIVTESLKHLVALRLLKNMTARAYLHAVAAFGSVSGILGASAKDWASVSDLKRIHPARLKDKTLWKEVDEEIERATRAGIDLIPLSDPRYPSLLKEIFDPPFLLYVKGALPKEASLPLAVVGSREASGPGLRLAETLGRELAASGAVVVSGLARGIDTAAHRGAVAAQGCTLAVLGCGLSQIYPPENRKLAEKITSSGGALISELPLEAGPLAMHFPMRNRIISGLSRAVIVVEAREKSGALITADMALEQGRDVYAFPGNPELKKTNGSNNLLKQGAKVATSYEDILNEYGWKARSKKSGDVLKKKPQTLTDEEKKLLRHLKQSDALHLDDLLEKSAQTPGKIMSVLTELTLKGVVRELPGKYFERVSS